MLYLIFILWVLIFFFFHFVLVYILLISDIDELYMNKNVFVYHVYFKNYQNIYGINMFNILFNMKISYLDFIHNSIIDKMIWLIHHFLFDYNIHAKSNHVHECYSTKICSIDDFMWFLLILFFFNWWFLNDKEQESSCYTDF
jgi:hypothetical protein